MSVYQSRLKSSLADQDTLIECNKMIGFGLVSLFNGT